MSSDPVGDVQQTANNLVDAAQNVANSAVNAGRGEVGTILNAVGETLGHLQRLFTELSSTVKGD